ncbi:hypothetical protein HN419_04420 [Candidatus Woesearchaeota archaeon]|jgi:XTP/dITP diphosphohydrolase|nr:hypothetical protein [Candidatus Woesearchaeota archaeon]MBT3537877.1 hypothetical protein [Candidatus Woesearchaeota archaeon]MBT4698008.1 hypothetical protein [Candidatus Woesearchaeota archaeon]MBT4716597.1 hypothetical protein [Candidatus Woesearchaeota archaeon]MBT7105546.1 hypothetical protein [Candidatus Woesearchaeota archaeon]
MSVIYFATGNKAKLEQLKYICRKYSPKSEVVSLKHLHGEEAEYEEIGESAEEIAVQGAEYLFSKFKVPLVTEDSIIEVDSLGGRPGLRSHKYLKDNGRAGLIKELKDEENRTARITSVVVYKDENNLKVFKNVVEGKIAKEESWREDATLWIGPVEHEFGGGFNSHFIANSCPDKTLADMTPEEGIEYGYREKNFIELLEFLKNQ